MKKALVQSSPLYATSPLDIGMPKHIADSGGMHNILSEMETAKEDGARENFESAYISPR